MTVEQSFRQVSYDLSDLESEVKRAWKHHLNQRHEWWHEVDSALVEIIKRAEAARANVHRFAMLHNPDEMR